MNLHQLSEDARLKFLRVLNRLAGSLCAAVLALNIAYPQAITQLTSLPKWALFPAALAWLSIVEYASRRPKDAA